MVQVLVEFLRYYVAEGVRIYSQDTWKQITDGHGKELVEKFIQPTVSAMPCHCI